MKKPKDCLTIDEIRKEIDTIDEQIIGLLGERFQYVKEIVRFKKDEEDVLARRRYEQVIDIRRSWAIEEGLNPDVIEKVYHMLMQYFIEEQKRMMRIG